MSTRVDLADLPTVSLTETVAGSDCVYRSHHVSRFRSQALRRTAHQSVERETLCGMQEGGIIGASRFSCFGDQVYI